MDLLLDAALSKIENQLFTDSVQDAELLKKIIDLVLTGEIDETTLTTFLDVERADNRTGEMGRLDNSPAP